MTDSTRHSRDDEPQPFSYGGTPGHPAPAPPPYQPQQPVITPSGATVWPGGSGGAGGGADTAAFADGPRPGGRRGRRRAPRSMALIAAVAAVSALVGGGASALAVRAMDKPGTEISTPVVNADSRSDSGVAAVATAVSPSIVEISASSANGKATGSGVVLTRDGEIITNNHVISGAASIKVSFHDGSTRSASVVGTDSGKDLALIKVKGASGLKPATLGDSSRVQVGDQVVAIGSPEGLTGTVTSGIVSALDRKVTVSTGEDQGQGRDGGRWPFEFGGGQYNGDVGPSTTSYKAIQTDASLNPGNSGGALINMKGQVIGINSAMYSTASGGSGGSGSQGSVGLGFSIPVNTLKADLDTLRDGGTRS
ncbi:trypsin-like peptidase domain-containing protein [Streptomyces sp. NA02950]|uniref:S1C family serine protease n=1 Tax=Streptomyces sp. NA02950 TaxID=2742137 RepID=UPI001590416F|nr:trypsin-like peptidase domain-containing protein [Streptomyces sp. NA02950]QKV93451.1 trypsin-like peptidase domain-containing protein [Streptomyces sp. NA02950]